MKYLYIVEIFDDLLTEYYKLQKYFCTAFELHYAICYTKNKLLFKVPTKQTLVRCEPRSFAMVNSRIYDNVSLNCQQVP